MKHAFLILAILVLLSVFSGCQAQKETSGINDDKNSADDITTDKTTESIDSELNEAITEIDKLETELDIDYFDDIESELEMLENIEFS